MIDPGSLDVFDELRAYQGRASAIEQALLIALGTLSDLAKEYEAQNLSAPRGRARLALLRCKELLESSGAVQRMGPTG